MFAYNRAASAIPRQILHPANLAHALVVACYSTSSTAPTPSTAAPSRPSTAAPLRSNTTAPVKTGGYGGYGQASNSTSSSVTSPSAPSPNFRPANSPPSPVVYQPNNFPHCQGEPTRLVPSDVPVLDWTNSFYGVAARPVTEEQYRSLMRPILEQDIEVKPDGIIYLPEIKYRRRLNETFGPMGWGLVPKGEAKVNTNTVTREFALIVEGRFAAQAQGENPFFSPDQLSSAIEGCKSNALMRCCKDLGISSELWDPHFIRRFKKAHMVEVWVEHATTKKKRTQWYRRGQVEVAYPYKAVTR